MMREMKSAKKTRIAYQPHESLSVAVRTPESGRDRQRQPALPQLNSCASTNIQQISHKNNAQQNHFFFLSLDKKR